MAMASIPGQVHISFLSFFTLFLIVHAKLKLHPSDHKALLLIQKNWGINGQCHGLYSTPCNSTGAFCERRIISNNSNVFRIMRIVFESQGLRGVLSPEIGRLSELKELSLPNNHLVDRIPPEIFGCRKLEILNLERNGFFGEIPSELSSLIRLRVLDLSSNKFSGNLNFLKHFPNLEKLSIANNMFIGKVPPSLKSFRNLRFFNISENNFIEGPVPVPVMNRVEYSSLQPTEENRVPKRYILAEIAKRSNQTSAMAPSASKDSSTNTAQAPSPAATLVKDKEDKKNVGEWILGFLVGGLAGTISGLLLSLLFKLIWFLILGEEKEPGPAIYSSLIKKVEDLAFLEEEDGLESLEIIGRGGCGEVYKAELPGSNGKIIAIKKVIQPPMDAAELTEEDTKSLNKKMRQIRSEIQTVGRIRHRNLVPLLAHFSRQDCHLLVYEFMKNGSLQDILQQVSQGTRELDWLARHRIAMGVADGLEYLHMNHSPRIIHRDLKPANVLLDDHMEARIADFGLAKTVPDSKTHVTTSNVAGTVGYIAPEYYQTLKFTDKCDIYSFGVLLAVLVIGKLPSDEFFNNTSEVGLVKWMRNVMISEDPNRAIDPTLMGNGYEEQMFLVLKIACFCTLDNPKERPNSKDVKCMLSQINHQINVQNNDLSSDASE